MSTEKSLRHGCHSYAIFETSRILGKSCIAEDKVTGFIVSLKNGLTLFDKTHLSS